MVLLSLDTSATDCYSLPSPRYSAELVDATGLCRDYDDVNVSHLMLLVTPHHVIMYYQYNQKSFVQLVASTPYHKAKMPSTEGRRSTLIITKTGCLLMILFIRIVTLLLANHLMHISVQRLQHTMSYKDTPCLLSERACPDQL